MHELIPLPSQDSLATLEGLGNQTALVNRRNGVLDTRGRLRVTSVVCTAQEGLWGQALSAPWPHSSMQRQASSVQLHDCPHWRTSGSQQELLPGQSRRLLLRR